MGISAVFLVLSVLSLACNVGSTANGIVGFGISLYPDLCCQSCHDSLSALYLSCTTFDMSMDMTDMDMGMSMMAMTDDDCRASNTPWLQTMAYCIQQNCNADGYPADKQAQCFSNQALAGASKPTFQDSLPSTPPTVELAGDAEWLNVTSLVNRDLYYSTHGTLGEFARSEYYHTKYSVALYLVVTGIVIICGIIAQLRSAFPGFQRKLQASTIWANLQQHLFLPALFGTRRLEPLPGNTGYIPGRALSIFIGFFVIINVIFSAISFRSFQPNIYFLSTGFELCEYVGNRTGTLSLVNMTMAILFAGRNNLLIAFTGWSQTTFLTLHRWAARVAAVQAVVHSIVYTMAYWEPGYEGATAYAAKIAEPFYYWGIIATIAFCLAAGVAVLPLRMKAYELFLISHIALVILTLVGCWYHLVPHFGLDYGYQVWLYIAFAFWGAEHFARLVRVAYFNRLGTSTAVIKAIPDCNIMEVTLFPAVAWNFRPGQHSFLYFPASGKFWESHPFSIAAWKSQGQPSLSSAPNPSDSSEQGENAKDTATVQHQALAQDRPFIRFLIHVHHGMTAALRRNLLSSSSPSPVEISVLTSGPYAGHRATVQPLQMADTVVCIVGGIGITHVLGFVQEYINANLQKVEGAGNARGIMKRAKRFILAWSAREMALIEHVKQNFLVDAAQGVECLFWCTGAETAARKLDSPNHETLKLQILSTATATSGRMDIGTVIRSSLEPGLQTTVLVCGPGSMVDETTRQVVNCVKDGFRVDLVEEAYAW